MAVTLPLLSCLGEAKRSPHSPLALQGNDGLPLCAASHSVDHTAQGMGFLFWPPSSCTIWLEVPSQLVPADPEPAISPNPSPNGTHVPSAGLYPYRCHPRLWAGLTLQPYVISPVPTAPWLLTPFTGCWGLDLRFGNVYLFEL